MKIVFSWLQEFIDLNKSPDETAEILTNLGFETTSEKVRANFSELVVGKVLSKEKHPFADKLSLCRVSDGQNSFNVVCGAHNVAKGQLVPFAKLGAKLGEIEIKKTKIRGIESEGMICSEQELGISDNSSGIMVLEQGAALGSNFSELYPDDFILDVEPLPNRPDILSHYGIALELSAPLKTSVRLPEIYEEKILSKTVLAAVVAKDFCGRYIAVYLKDIKITQSSEKIKRRLSLCGLRAINNIVDITNYCMLELGHPTHAFDRNKLDGGSIVVRLASDGEELSALDGKKYELKSSDLIIADSAAPAAIAGVIGGAASEVGDNTVELLLESAVFEPQIVFNTRKRLNVATEATYRFERGMFFERCELTARRALKLITSTNSGVIESISDIGAPPKRNSITVEFEKIRRHTGIEIPPEKTKNILEGLSFSIKEFDDKRITVVPPYWRCDVLLREDLIEELVRVFGYGNIKSSAQMQRISRLSEQYYAFRKVNGIRKALRDMGFCEAVNYGMISSAWSEYLEGIEYMKVINPVSPEMSIMRPSLFFELWQNFVANYNDGQKNQFLFEVGNVLTSVSQKNMLGLLLHGDIFDGNWKKIELKSSYLTLKGIIENAVLPDHVLTIKTEKEVFPAYIAASSCLTVNINNCVVGQIGAVSEKIALKDGIPEVVWWAELDLDKLSALSSPPASFSQYSVFPSSSRDFSFFISEGLSWQIICDEIKKILSVQSVIAEEIKLLDIYTGANAKMDSRKSMTVRVVIRHPSRTFTTEELKGIFDGLFSMLQAQLPLTPRA